MILFIYIYIYNCRIKVIAFRWLSLDSSFIRASGGNLSAEVVGWVAMARLRRHDGAVPPILHQAGEAEQPREQSSSNIKENPIKVSK